MIKLYVARRLRNVGLSTCEGYVGSNPTVPVLPWIVIRLGDLPRLEGECFRAYRFESCTIRFAGE